MCSEGRRLGVILQRSAGSGKEAARRKRLEKSRTINSRLVFLLGPERGEASDACLCGLEILFAYLCLHFNSVKREETLRFLPKLSFNASESLGGVRLVAFVALIHSVHSSLSLLTYQRR